ncbi:tagaturonate reductase [Pontibacter sp. G13]|uniref:tagaturonate reductase n=1 Tax=Pontibacter sp. G13 TaxID=3074898 RepID=UPI00288B9D2B|nr:tagaturonate reductase [Pontibacter sp. G13]WNJ20072.1 tagaturonate reductase [Pontibacter sp. G13]
MNQETGHPMFTPKVIQFGGGNFLRGFATWMVQKLNEYTDFAGEVVVVKPTERGDYDRLRQSNGYYHVILQGIQHGMPVHEAHPITCISQIIQPYHSWVEFLETASQTDIRYLISNTTESGIEFQAEPIPNHASPKTFPGKWTWWLYRRFQFFAGAGNKGVIHLPCELVPANGEQLRTAILQYARLWNLGEDFEQWILQHNHFCNTLVDRIVSGYSEPQARSWAPKLGYKDEQIVVGEPYHSWVIQGPEAVEEELVFLNPQLNVEWVADLEVYQHRKVRVLNGAHTSMVPLGHLLGLETVADVMSHAGLSTFVQDLLIEEVLPTLPLERSAGIEYVQQTLERFRNPDLKHKLLDISLNSLMKFRTRLMGTMVDYHAKTGEWPKRIMLAWVGLILFYRGQMDGKEIPLRDDPDGIAWMKKAWQFHESGDTAQMIEHLLGLPAWKPVMDAPDSLKSAMMCQLERCLDRGVDAELKELTPIKTS